MPTSTHSDTVLRQAAQRLYEAETALHAAHASHVDVWIGAAGDRLHDAVVSYLTARDNARLPGAPA